MNLEGSSCRQEDVELDSVSAPLPPSVMTISCTDLTSSSIHGKLRSTLQRKLRISLQCDLLVTSIHFRLTRDNSTLLSLREIAATVLSRTTTQREGESAVYLNTKRHYVRIFKVPNRKTLVPNPVINQTSPTQIPTSMPCQIPS